MVVTISCYARSCVIVAQVHRSLFCVRICVRMAVLQVIAMSHFPLHISAAAADDLPAEWVASEAAEAAGIGNPPEEVLRQFAGQRSQCADSELSLDDNRSGHCPQTAAEALASTVESWEALFDQYGVDFYVAGHYHEYESMWPQRAGVPTQFNFTEPNGTIHVSGTCWISLLCHFSFCNQCLVKIMATALSCC